MVYRFKRGGGDRSDGGADGDFDTGFGNGFVVFWDVHVDGGDDGVRGEREE